jgi:predicted amidohydrolase
MRIGFFQFKPELDAVETNLSRITTALAKLDADLVVLPEMCTAGYMVPSRAELLRRAEPVPDGPSCRAIGRLCRERKLNVVFGMAELDRDRIFNSAILATADGRFHVFRKAHLFWDEKDFFEPGDLPFPVFDVAGVKVGMLVCFDHFFPEAARSLALKGAQVICHPANLVLEPAQTTTVSRAIENRVFWILANRVGDETLGRRTLRFTGKSQVVEPDGKVLCHASPDSEESGIVEVDPALALDKHVTPRNDLLADRRTDLYFR